MSLISSALKDGTKLSEVVGKGIDVANKADTAFTLASTFMPAIMPGGSGASALSMPQSNLNLSQNVDDDDSGDDGGDDSGSQPALPASTPAPSPTGA
jgi:hypothetical protein